MNLLEIHNLSKVFTLHILKEKKIEALKNIHLMVARGEIIGLTGKSGSGKSSLMKCIYRTYLASHGQIIYHTEEGSLDLVKASDHEIIALRKREITYCSQFLQVIPRVSALEVVCENLFKIGVGKEIARARGRTLLDKLGLSPDLWDAFPLTFSGGEQQRINVARSIINPPHLLLIDEPTASLDQKTKDTVIDLILNLKAAGTTIICISHDEYTLEKLVDRRVNLELGKIISQNDTSTHYSTSNSIS